MFIYSYKFGSESARELSQATGYRRIRHENSNFRGNSNKTVINYGATELPEEVMRCNIINPPDLVRSASNKKYFFRACQEAEDGPRTPEWTTDREHVLEALQEGSVWLARTVLAGHSGEGIVVMENEEDLVNASLYTKYVKKKNEYRIHVANGQVFDIQRKAKRTDAEEVNWQIRNHANGFIYMRGDSHETPQDVLDQAVKGLNVTGLDFGAVDVIWNEYKKEAYVLEVNTAPGLTGTTLDNYVEMFNVHMDN